MLAGPVLRRARAGWAVLLAAFLVLLVSVSLIAAGVLYGDAVANGGVRRALHTSAPASQAMLVTTVASADRLPGIDPVVREQLRAAMEPVGGSVSLLVGSGPWVTDGALPDEEDDEETPVGSPDDAPPPVPLVRVAAIEDLASHATLAEGDWPVAGATPLQASLSSGAAAAMGVKVADTVRLVGRTNPDLTLEAVVTGTWNPDPGDPFWFGDGLLLEGTQVAGSFTTLGPLVLERPDLLTAAAVPQLDATWRAQPALDRLTADDVGALGASVATADERLRSALPPPPAITVTTELPATLVAVGTAVTVSRAGVLILTLEFAVLAGYAIVMVGGMLADRRRGEVALLRSRGAGTGALVAMSLLEALLLTVPAVALAPVLAVALVQLVGEVGPLAEPGAIAAPTVTPAALAATLVAGLGCLVALAAPAVRSASSPAGERAATARPVGRGLAGRLVVDLVMLALAALAVWQLRLYGGVLTRDARGALGIDPLLIAAPALTLLAGALLGTRLLPRLAELLSPAAGRATGAIAPLATWSIARRPSRAARAALLLMLAAALGTFAATYHATWARSQDDQAAHAAGADVRAVMSDYPELPAWAVGPALRRLPGVEAAAGMGVRSLDSGRVIRNGTLLAVDAGTLTAAMDAEGPAARTPGTLPAAAMALAEARTTDGTAIPPEAAGILVGVGGLRTTDLITGVPVDEPHATIEVVAVLANSDGVHRVSLGSVPATPGVQAVGTSLVGSTAAGELPIESPARLLALELVVTAGPTEILAGELVVDRVEWTETDPSATPAPRGGSLLGDSTAGWGWMTQGLGGPPQAVEAGPGDGVPVATGDGTIPPILGSPNPPTVFRLQPPAPATIELPAVVSDAFLALTGARPGDAVAATVSGLPVVLRILDRLAAVPARAADEPVVIVDAATLGNAEYLAIARLAPAREWWLAAAPDAAEVVADAVREPPFGATEVVGRDALAVALGSDPVSLGVIGALAIGAIAALAMAALGFLLSATVAAGERLGEFAVLRALGLPGASVRRWLLLEGAATLAFGLLAGTALGLLLAWLVLPFASLTASGDPPVPPAAMVIPWGIIGLVLVAGGLSLLALTALVTRGIPGSSLGGVLRAKGTL